MGSYVDDSFDSILLWNKHWNGKTFYAVTTVVTDNLTQWMSPPDKNIDNVSTTNVHTNVHVGVRVYVYVYPNKKENFTVYTS